MRKKKKPATDLSGGCGQRLPADDDEREPHRMPAIRETLPFVTSLPAASNLGGTALTIGELVAIYLRLEGPELSAKSLKQRRRHLELLAERFGSLPWDGLHKSELKAWIRDVPTWDSDNTRRSAVAGIRR